MHPSEEEYEIAMEYGTQVLLSKQNPNHPSISMEHLSHHKLERQENYNLPLNVVASHDLLTENMNEERSVTNMQENENASVSSQNLFVGSEQPSTMMLSQTWAQAKNPLNVLKNNDNEKSHEAS